ncbi:MAG TPA: HlyD family secretion protein [Steroidobacteraceae bacterium]|nr:HlyD family secretion protein [Steroidobacteraceae bacterium]
MQTLATSAAAPATAGSVPRESEVIPSRRLAPYVAGTILVLAAAAAAHHWLTVGRFLESTDDAYVGGDVTVIAPKVAGFIEQVAVTDNQAVHAGDLLVKLDDRDFRAALARADAAVAAKEAARADLDATVKLQRAVIAEARASIAAADAETARAREDKARFDRLSGKGAVSLESTQKADADYAQAVAAADRARAALSAARRQADVIEAQQQQAAATLAQARAERTLARLNLDYTELRSPVDGVVGNRSARTGAYAAVGAELLAIVPARGLWVDANFKESQLGGMRPGQPAAIEADVMPGERFHGHVQSLSPATGAQFSVLPAENATGNFTRIVQRVPVRIALDGGASQLGRLRPGLSVTVTVDQRR